MRESCKAKEAKLGSFEAVQALLAALSVENGGTTIRLSGVNLQIVSGSGATAGPINGKGNLIVGYDEPLMWGHCSATTDFSCDRDSCCPTGERCQLEPMIFSEKTGSHNFVIGPGHTYTSSGGFVGGRGNFITGPFASVSGGEANLAGVGEPLPFGCQIPPPGEAAAVSGGIFNTANGADASVSGGEANLAGGFAASVSGGGSNRASGVSAWVGGGEENAATGILASVSGGLANIAGPGTPGSSALLGDQGASVCGGFQNAASGGAASVSGGSNNVVSGAKSSVGGGTVPEVTGTNEWHATITSGFPSTTEY